MFLKMFDILFGWKKASKCKKLIRMAQCRLKLLKNKMCCIVKQLRHNVSQLLKHGHHQAAFQRVEQIFRDESMVEIYELLGHYCDFIIMTLPYIRKHKDLPNDINEAVSTLIFSSARFGELPELMSIRKLFGERYGHRLITSTLELLPGNLVNQQIKEDLYAKTVTDDVKYRLLNEIAGSFVEPEILLLEYKPCFQEQRATNSSMSANSNRDVRYEMQEVYDATEGDGKIVYVDLASKSKKYLEDPCYKELLPISGATFSATTVLDESSSETSAQMPEEMIYLDDIEEFASPGNKDGKFQDQRLFKFTSFRVPLKDKTNFANDQKALSQNEKLLPRKIGKSSRKRSRNVIDVECAIYYGESDEALPDNKQKSLHQKQHMKIKNSSKITNSLETENIQHGLQLCAYTYRDEPQKNGAGQEETVPAYPRALTMQDERPHMDNIIRPCSFSLEQPHCRHVHPKLPDYDELAAKFMALKKANMEKRTQASNQEL